MRKLLIALLVTVMFAAGSIPAYAVGPRIDFIDLTTGQNITDSQNYMHLIIGHRYRMKATYGTYLWDEIYMQSGSYGASTWSNVVWTWENFSGNQSHSVTCSQVLPQNCWVKGNGETPVIRWLMVEKTLVSLSSCSFQRNFVTGSFYDVDGNRVDTPNYIYCL